MKPDTSPNQYPDRVPEHNETPAAPAESPLNSSTSESAPNLSPVAPEAPVISPEQTEAQPERRVKEPTIQPSADNDDAAATLPPVQPMQTPPTSPYSGDADDTDSPAIADDVDVIEKVWVDKAKQVIAKTKDDPYQQEQQVEKLQQNYLKKRYGKTINPSPEL